MQKATLVIGIPFSGRYVPPEWALSLATLSIPMNTNYSYYTLKGLVRDQAREKIVEQAIEAGSKYLFFMDDDTAPPSFALHELIYALENADDDVAFCGGIYCTKSNPPAPIVSKDAGSGPFWKWKTGEIFECPYIGTGCLLIKTEIFKHISRPWFKDISGLEEAKKYGLDVSDEDSHKYNMTDDIFFCTKLQQAGYRGLANGKVLPVHFDQQGQAFILPEDSYPVRNGTVSPLVGFGFRLERVNTPESSSEPEEIATNQSV